MNMQIISPSQLAYVNTSAANIYQPHLQLYKPIPCSIQIVVYHSSTVPTYILRNTYVSLASTDHREAFLAINIIYARILWIRF
jgi:hypothetical protein